MSLSVRFATLSAPFAVLPAVFVFPDRAAALAAVTEYATAAGYSRIAEVLDADFSIRYTARTPGGRGGRNVAFADFNET